MTSCTEKHCEQGLSHLRVAGNNVVQTLLPRHVLPLQLRRGSLGCAAFPGRGSEGLLIVACAARNVTPGMPMGANQLDDRMN